MLLEGNSDLKHCPQTCEGNGQKKVLGNGKSDAGWSFIKVGIVLSLIKCHAMKMYGMYMLPLSNISTALPPRKKLSQYPINGKQNGPQSWFGWCGEEKNS
jgi:hypothetical protein